MRNINTNPAGFTLIEILVSIVIFAVIGTVTLSILFVTLRTGKKSDLLVVLKQNGNAAITQITRNIRYAKSLDSPTSCIPSAVTQSITVTSLVDDAQTTYACVVGPSATITSNGESLLDTNVATVTNCSFTCTQATAIDPPTIRLTFNLVSRNSNNLVETTGIVPFQASVTMRNYNK